MSDSLIYLEPRSVFDNHILGICSSPYAVTYDLDALLKHWAKGFQNEETSEQEAYEKALHWFEHNVESSYMGEHTPLYVSPRNK